MSRVIRPAPDRAAPLSRAPARPSRTEGGRPSRLRLWLRRHRGSLRRAGLAGVALAGLGGAVLTARALHLGDGLTALHERAGQAANLRVRDIVVEGRSNLPERALRAALGVSRGDSLLGVQLDTVRARVEALPWVQGATVERRLPGTLVVRVTERRPFALWQHQGRFVLIDRAGARLAEQDVTRDAAAFSQLPLVVGAGAAERAAGLLDQLAAQPDLKARVVAAVRVGERRWNLRLANGADVLLPEGAEGAAMTRLMELHASGAVLDRPLQSFDLRLPDRMVVRPADPPLPLPPAAGPRRPT